MDAIKSGVESKTQLSAHPAERSNTQNIWGQNFRLLKTLPKLGSPLFTVQDLPFQSQYPYLLFIHDRRSRGIFALWDRCGSGIHKNSAPLPYNGSYMCMSRYGQVYVRIEGHLPEEGEVVAVHHKYFLSVPPN